MTYQPARPLLAHQATELSRMLGQESWALLMEFGTGKSAVIVADAGRLYTEGKINGVLILAPKGVYRDWSEENPETSHWCLNLDPRIFPVFLTRWTGGHTKLEKWQLSQMKDQKGLVILVVNTEALSNGNRAFDVCMDFLTRRQCMLVCDESTQLKSPSAKRTKKVIKLADHAKYRRILTGFPAPRSSLDLYSQFQVLDWKILGHKSFFTYRIRYAVIQPLYLGSRTIQQVVGYKNTAELWSKISPYSSRVRADDCLDLPPLQYVKREVEMPAETRRVYRDLCNQATSELDGGGHVTATLAITLIMRLHQIACGHVTTEDGALSVLPCDKLDELFELIEEIGETEKIVIWSHWRHSIQEITYALWKKFGTGSTVQYYGETTETQRAENLHRFAHDPECRFFVGSQMAGGRGINDLVVARHAVFYSNPPDLELRLNAEARTRRKGSEHHSSVVYHDLITANTVEEKIVKSLRERLDLASLVVGDKIRDWLV
jgi:SNF2 family DNA or RNA helicase